MNITKETKLKDLLTEYPWLKEEIVKVNDKFGITEKKERLKSTHSCTQASTGGYDYQKIPC